MDRSKRAMLSLLITSFVTLTWSLVAGWLYYQKSQEAEQHRVALAAIQERDAAIQSMRDSANHGLVTLNHEGLVVEWNPAMERISGRSEAEMLGETLEVVMSPEDWQKHAPAMQKQMDYAKSIQHMQKPRPVIEARTVYCHIVPEDPTKEPVFVRASIRVSVPDQASGKQPSALGFIDPWWAIPEEDLPEEQKAARVRARAKMRRG